MARFTPDVVDKLLDRLSSDDAFRDLFAKDPREALNQVGHVTPKAQVGVAGQDAVMCCSVSTLASKEQLKASRKELTARILIQNPFAYFEADPTT
ncbi:hypothetical protein BH11PSE14_BH11PSE14_23020 [soil metagenome]